MRLSFTAIAAALGITRQAVAKCAAQGMPTDSIEAARAWRAANLHPARMKRPPAAPAAMAQAPPWPGGAAQLLADVQAIASLAAKHPDDVGLLLAVDELVRLLTDEQFGAVVLPVSVWRRLMALWGAVQAPAVGQSGSA